MKCILYYSHYINYLSLKGIALLMKLQIEDVNYRPKAFYINAEKESLMLIVVVANANF